MKGFCGVARFSAALLVLGGLAGVVGGTCSPAYAQGAASLLSEKAKADKAKSAKAKAGKAKAEEGKKPPDDLSSASAGELEALAKTLENTEERKKFLATLKALIAARKADEKKAAKPGIGNGIATRIAGAMSKSMQALGERVGALIGVLRDAPRLIPWAETWVVKDPKRDRLIGLIWRFIVIVGIGMLVQFVFRRGTRRWRQAIDGDQATGIGNRAVGFVLRTFLLFGNAIAYGVGAYGAFVALPMTGAAGEVLLVGASSFFVAKLILATTRVIVAPGTPLLRPLPITDETANYLYIWVRRLVRIFVYSFFFLKATQLVGLPEPAYRALLYLLGLALVGFLVVFVLQNRISVAAAIRGRRQTSGRYGGLRARLSGTWHFFAILYVVAVYAVWVFDVEDGFEYLMVATFWTLVTLAGARILVFGALWGIARLFAVSAELDARFPGLEARANRYLPVFNGIIAWTMYIGASLVVLDVWGVDTLGWLASPEGASVLRKAVTVAFILLFGVIIWEAINIAIGRYLDQMDDDVKGAARARTLLPLMRMTALIFISAVVLLTMLSEVGFNIGPLLAGAGVIGLAIGFGSQKLVQDVITGLFILIEDTLAVGDVVRLDADHSGVVEALSLRSVKLRDLSGNVHTLPFSEVKTILNMTKDWSFYVFEVGVAYRENIDRVMDVLREIGAELQADPDFGEFIVEPLEVLGLDKFGDSAIIIKARIKVDPPIKQWAVGREFNRLMKARFDAEGIEIPFPHRTIYFGEDHEGNAPPAQVAMVEKVRPTEQAAAPAAGRRGRTNSDNVDGAEGDG